MIEKYKPNDKIYLFGFSRGSFVARILAGMIEKIGLLDNGLEAMVKTAWEIYKSWEQVGQPNDSSNHTSCEYSLKLFKQTFCRYNVSIEFMGLFDSINSCGILFDRLFPFTSNSSNVNHIRHAVSIHERRSKFKQNLFIPHSYLPHFLSTKTSCDCDPNEDNNNNDDVISTHTLLSELQLPDDDSVTRSHQISVQFSKKCSSDLLEVWFPGDHSDVGGSWPYDDNGNKLSNLSLRWILSNALEFGVLFKNSALDEFNSKFNPLKTALSFRHDLLSFARYNYPNDFNPYCVQSAIEEQLNDETLLSNNASDIDDNNDNINIRSPLFPNFSLKVNSNNENRDDIDNLIKNGEKIETFKGHGNISLFSTLFWWMLEVIPIGYLVENQQGRWRPLYWPNMGEHRNIPNGAKIHWSILWRMKFVKDPGYSHLPIIFRILQKIIDSNDFNDDNSIFYTTESNETQTITLRLIDLVDFRTGTIRTDITTFMGNVLKEYKYIRLNIDWENPPNELSYKMKTRNEGFS